MLGTLNWYFRVTQRAMFRPDMQPLRTLYAKAAPREPNGDAEQGRRARAALWNRPVQIAADEAAFLLREWTNRIQAAPTPYRPERWLTRNDRHGRDGRVQAPPRHRRRPLLAGRTAHGECVCCVCLCSQGSTTNNRSDMASRKSCL